MNRIGVGAASSEVQIYAAKVPEAPAAPTLISQSATEITIAWADMSGRRLQESVTVRNGGSPILDYKLLWDNPEDDQEFIVLAENTLPSYTYTVRNLTPGLKYRFRVVAVNIIGESEQSVTATFFASSFALAPSRPIVVGRTDIPTLTI